MSEAEISEAEISEEEKAKKLFEKGMAELKKGNNVDATFIFEDMVVITQRNPMALTCLGLTTARAKLDMKLAEKCCLEAVKKSPYKSSFYLNLAEVYLLSGSRRKAVQILHKGLKMNKGDRAILKEMKKLGIREKPPIPFLPRSNFINKYIGIFRSKHKSA